MTTVVLDMSMSLDDYISGPDDEDRGLYDWYFDPDIDAASSAVKDEGIASFTAIVLGKNAYGGGFDDTPYDAVHFVVTHEEPQTVTHGPVTFVFVGSVEDAVEQARAAAGDGDVAIGGGADIAQQCLAAGLVDEVQLHVVPKILGAGKRLFGTTAVDLEPTRTVEAAGVTHLFYRVRSGRPRAR